MGQQEKKLRRGKSPPQREKGGIIVNSASESLLQAIDLLVDKRMGQLRFDKTIQAEIYSIVDLDTGEYQVKYAGNVFSAFAQDTTKSFSVGDNVYVTVPEGDFDNKKMITGVIRSSSLSYSEINELNSQVVESSPTFDNMYGYSDESEYGVIAGAPSEDHNSKFVIFEASDDTPHNLFAQYALTNELIRIRASFLTRFHMEHTQGNYGLEIRFFTKGDPVVFRLDVSSFLGNPYSYTVYSPQTIIIQVPTGYLTGLQSITLFEENFVYDRYVENGLVTDRENTTNANIFVSNIELGFVKAVDALGAPYRLDIMAPQGRFLTTTTTTINLVGRLVHEEQNIMSESNCTCRWFERDVSVMVGDEEYDKDAGVGWKPVTTNDFNILTLQLSDVPYLSEYKLITVYNNSTILPATEEVQNLTVGYDLALVQDTRGEDLVIYINDSDLVGDWYALYPDGNYQLIAEKQNEIVANDFLNYSSVTFYCGVYDEAQTRYIATLPHTITASDSADDITISYVGDDTFRYDANGDIAIEDAERERTLQVTLAWKNGVATSYTVEWIGPDGQELTSQPYNPSESMMEEISIDNNNILHYHIKQKYKVNYTNNTFTVRIVTIDGNEYSFLKEVLFLKDGDQGTNGTTYVVAVRPCDVNGVKLAGFNPLVYYDGAWSGNLPLRCYVYKDGELINNNSNFTLEYTWTPYNVLLTSEAEGMEDRQIATGIDSIITTPIAPYVTVEVEINDSINDRTTTVYAYYPLDVAVNYTGNEIDTIDISSIPSYIKYTSGGTNPQFYSNNIEFIYDGTSYSQYITSLNTNILELENNDGLIYLNPASSFIFEDTQIPMLRCAASADSTSYVLHPIVVYLDTYGNETINGWDGQRLTVDEENGEYILAPQIGAGTKDSMNRFTGIVMGQNSSPEEGRNEVIGLYGYNAGTNTFGLQATGKAYFGVGNGQIIIDGTQATISGGGGGNSTTGMTIILNNPNNSASTRAINIANGNFYVTYDGSVTATRGYIGGWVIDTNDLHSNTTMSNGYVALNSLYNSNWNLTYSDLQSNNNLTQEQKNSYFAMWAGRTDGYSASQYSFAVSKRGELYAKSGNIGGWTIERTYLYNSSSSNRQVGMGTQNAAFWAGAGLTYTSTSIPRNQSTGFLVTSSGNLYCKNANVGGEITADRGSFYGSVILYPPDGSNEDSSGNPRFAYNNYTYTEGNSTLNNPTTEYLDYISISNMITNLLTNESRATATASLAKYAATSAQSAASQAQSAASQAQSTSEYAAQIATIASDASTKATEAADGAAKGVEALNWITNRMDYGYDYVYMTSDVNGSGARVYVDGYDAGIQNMRYGRSAFVDVYQDGKVTVHSDTLIWMEGPINGDSSHFTSNGSDRRIKHDISYENISEYSNFFFNLQPVEFIFNKEKDQITKTLGFIAQDVLGSLGDKKAFVRQNIMLERDGELYYSLDYNSITTLNTYMLQEAYKKINILEQEVAELKALLKGENGDI